MSVFLIIDLIILALLIIFAIRGAYRGLVLSLCGLLAVVIAFVGAGIAARSLSPVVADMLEPRFSVIIEEKLTDSMESVPVQPDSSIQTEPSDDPDSPLHDVLDVLRDMGLYETLVDTINKAVSKGTADAAVGAAARVAAAVAQSVAYLIIFLLAFLLILLAWKLISQALNLLAKLPGLHFLNKTLGAVFGLVQCCILLFVVAWLLQFTGHIISEDTIARTHLLKFFMTTNPFTFLQGLV